jgi:hypothetical protein
MSSQEPSDSEVYAEAVRRAMKYAPPARFSPPGAAFLAAGCTVMILVLYDAAAGHDAGWLPLIVTVAAVSGVAYWNYASVKKRRGRAVNDEYRKLREEGWRGKVVGAPESNSESLDTTTRAARGRPR